MFFKNTRPMNLSITSLTRKYKDIINFLVDGASFFIDLMNFKILPVEINISFELIKYISTTFWIHTCIRKQPQYARFQEG